MTDGVGVACESKIENLKDIRPLRLRSVATMLSEFHAESVFADFTTYAADETFMTLYLGRFNDAVAYVAFDKDAPVGIAIFNIGAHFTTAPVGYEFLFFVKAEYRRFNIANDLLRACLEDMERRGVAGVFFMSAAGFKDGGKNHRALRLLCRRHGFSVLADSQIFFKNNLSVNENDSINKGC